MPWVVNARPVGHIAPPPEAVGRPGAIAGAGAAPAGFATVALRYLADSALRVSGAVTSRTYEFSAERPVQAVASPDAPALIASRLFRRA